MLTSVAETDEFVRRASGLLTDDEHKALIDLVSGNPEIGVSLGAGIRKFRFARPGGGKSSGYRVIHFYRPDNFTPAILLLIYPKNLQDTLTPIQLSRLKALGEAIAESYRSRE